MNSGLIGFTQQHAPSPTPVSTVDVSNPPTSAELTALFGDATNGFCAVIDDGGAGTTFWKIERVNGAWLYTSFSLAV